MAADPHALVAAYALDALDSSEEREFEEHLAACEPCRDELASLRETAAALAYDAPGPPPPLALRERILEQARGERPNVTPLPLARRRWTAPAATAALLGVGLWLTSRALLVL